MQNPWELTMGIHKIYKLAWLKNEIDINRYVLQIVSLSEIARRDAKSTNPAIDYQAETLREIQLQHFAETVRTGAGPVAHQFRAEGNRATRDQTRIGIST